MQVTYQLTPEDLVAAQRDLIAPDPRAQRRFWRNLLVVPLVAALLALAAVQFDVWSNWFVAPLIFSLFWVLFYTRSYRHAPERAVREWLAAIRDTEDLVSVGAYVNGSNPRVDEARERKEAIERFLCQAADTTCGFTDALADLTALDRAPVAAS